MGFPDGFRGYHRLGPLQGLRVSRYPGAYASPLHRRGGNRTRTGVKLSQASPVQPIPGCCHSRFWLTNRTDLLGHRRDGVVDERLLQRVAVERGIVGQLTDREPVLALRYRGQHIPGALVAADPPAAVDRPGGVRGEGADELQNVLAAADE